MCVCVPLSSSALTLISRLGLLLLIFALAEVIHLSPTLVDVDVDVGADRRRYFLNYYCSPRCMYSSHVSSFFMTTIAETKQKKKVS
ncbi:MAG: hypothetical protein BYD32DRAFT_429897 [Podila humilis]|nr:MAG: hypothetical protein BYD32DRAFT_429897 [Podila humilis]